MSKKNHIEEIVSTLPHSPGVYQYFNSDGEIIYVGKAKDLKKRVSSYFNKTDKSVKVQALVKHIADLKYIVVNTENDALLLENNLIKQYQPRYNILLKDGKTYPWICITKAVDGLFTGLLLFVFVFLISLFAFIKFPSFQKFFLQQKVFLCTGSK